MKSPKTPKPTAEETKMRQRQVEDTARLDDEENVRLKRIARGRSGGRSLLSGSVLGLAGTKAATGGSLSFTSGGKGGPGKVAAPQAQK